MSDNVTPLYTELSELADANTPRLAVALGVFDGVHRGHQALLQTTVQAASEMPGVFPAALTFDPHPSQVFSPERVPPLLQTLPARARHLRGCGAKHVVVARFTPAFATQSPPQFVEDVLLRRLKAACVIVGEDFRFGQNRSGDVAFLQAQGERFGFSVRAVAPVFVNGVPARSTTIRQMLAGGQLDTANHLLGRPYQLTGIVERGKQLGRTIGYPTANIASEPGVLVPGAGVYAGRVDLPDGRTVRAAVSIGTNPTVTPDRETSVVEAYLMDGFSGDLYGQTLTVEFRAFLRPMLRFDGLPELMEQMARDVQETLRLVEPTR